jgi:hypothetical protein
MSLKLTLKRKLGLLRKTAKKYLKSGGAKLSATAKEYIPELNSTKNMVNAFSLLNISNVTKNTTSISNEWSKLKQRIENAVAIDCEMVGVGRHSELAHVAIVDFNGKVIYDKYVIPKGGIESITDYRTKFSGITSAKLVHLDKKKHSFETVKREVHSILKGKTIVGHGLSNDFKVLDYVPKRDLVWDSTEIDMFKQNHPHIPGIKQPRKLKAIAKEFANNNIQLNTKTGHSPLEDARASMNLYRVSFDYPKIAYASMSHF